MRYTRAASLAVAVSLLGCAEGFDKSVTAPPSVRNIVVVAPAACDASIAAAVNAQQPQVFKDPVLAQAQALWDHVELVCETDLTTARDLMLAYVQFTIDQLKFGNVNAPAAGTAGDAVLNHWDYTFPYVDYPSPNLPSSVFGPEGAAGVITQATANRELAAENAAITVPIQYSTGDERPHLFVIHPLDNDCLAGTNLARTGPCFEFASFPTVSPEFDPRVKVGICQPVEEGEEVDAAAPALGHLTGGFVRIPAQQQYPTFCGAADLADAGSWSGGFGEFARRLAYVARSTIGVKPLYAVHGGLGGLGKGLSPFGGVDLMVFEASLTGGPIGGPPTADAGNWVMEVTRPGSVTVRSGLGAYEGRLIVMRQGGGNCAACGGLLLRGNLFDATAASGASMGTYDVSWISLQDKPTLKGAPFVLRGSDGREIARLTYLSTKTNKNALHYNSVEVGNWVRYQPQQFLVRVNLDTKKTTLFINGTEVVSNAGFVEDAANLATIGAEYTGIDSGVMGWAGITVQRIADE